MKRGVRAEEVGTVLAQQKVRGDGAQDEQADGVARTPEAGRGLMPALGMGHDERSFTGWLTAHCNAIVQKQESIAAEYTIESANCDRRGKLAQTRTHRH